MIAYLGLSSGRLYERPHDGTRPVLVLDPDNAEDMTAVMDAYAALRARLPRVEAFTEAVRTFLPKPIPPDPGMAARVTAGGVQWARDTDGWWWPLVSSLHIPTRRIWDDLCARYPDLTIEGGDES